MNIPSPAGPIAINGNANPISDLVVIADGNYNWGTNAATLGQRPKFIRMNSGGARVLTMPAVDLCVDWDVYVHNTNAGNTIQVNGPGAIGGTITGVSVGHYYCDGVTWFDLGELLAV